MGHAGERVAGGPKPSLSDAVRRFCGLNRRFAGGERGRRLRFVGGGGGVFGGAAGREDRVLERHPQLVRRGLLVRVGLLDERVGLVGGDGRALGCVGGLVGEGVELRVELVVHRGGGGGLRKLGQLRREEGVGQRLTSAGDALREAGAVGVGEQVARLLGEGVGARVAILGEGRERGGEPALHRR